MCVNLTRIASSHIEKHRYHGGGPKPRRCGCRPSVSDGPNKSISVIISFYKMCVIKVEIHFDFMISKLIQTSNTTGYESLSIPNPTHPLDIRVQWGRGAPFSDIRLAGILWPVGSLGARGLSFVFREERIEGENDGMRVCTGKAGHLRASGHHGQDRRESGVRDRLPPAQ
jgi:hypothetical protein